MLSAPLVKAEDLLYSKTDDCGGNGFEILTLLLKALFYIPDPLLLVGISLVLLFNYWKLMFEKVDLNSLPKDVALRCFESPAGFGLIGLNIFF